VHCCLQEVQDSGAGRECKNEFSVQVRVVAWQRAACRSSHVVRLCLWMRCVSLVSNSVVHAHSVSQLWPARTLTRWRTDRVAAVRHRGPEHLRGHGQVLLPRLLARGPRGTRLPPPPLRASRPSCSTDDDGAAGGPEEAKGALNVDFWMKPETASTDEMLQQITAAVDLVSDC